MVKTKIVSSLEKAFYDEPIDKFETLSELTALRGERVSCQNLLEFFGQGTFKRHALTRPRMSEY